jgi:hypothetical protein
MNNLFFKKEFDYFHNKIKNNEHFKYSRFNDGELIAISGNNPNGSNCDGHKYFPDMSIELKNILLNYKYSENYLLESFDHWYNTSLITKNVLDNLKQLNPELTFLHTDWIRISHEQESSKFFNLLDLLKTKNLVIIGADYLLNLKKFFNFTFIEIPLKNCYLQKNQVIDQIKRNNETLNNNYYLFSASMPTKIMIDTFKEDNENTYLDWGSVWDSFFVSPQFSFIRKRSTSNKDIYKQIYKNYLI